jgi:hemerythrin-like metal-binding protein
MDSIVVWNDLYSVGMPEIDEQHKVLFDLINQLWGAIINRSTIEDQVKLIEKLEHYTISHFTAEETFMRAFEYPDFDNHKKIHELFVKKIAQEKANLLATQHLSLDILNFLKDWLIDHIMVSDKAYAKYCKEKATPTSFVSKFFKGLFGSR